MVSGHLHRVLETSLGIAAANEMVKILNSVDVAEPPAATSKVKPAAKDAPAPAATQTPAEPATTTT